MQKDECAAVDSDKAHDQKYLERGRVKKKVRDLIAVRGRWIENYMIWLHTNLEDDLAQLKKGAQH